MTHQKLLGYWTTFLVLLVLALGHGRCTTAVCAHPDHSIAECRVVAEHQLASLSDQAGLRYDFIDPQLLAHAEGAAGGASGDASGGDWRSPGDRRPLPLGHWQLAADGMVRVRLAGLGDAALRIENPTAQAARVRLQLDNLAIDAELGLIDDLGHAVPWTALQTSRGLRRTIVFEVPAQRRLLLTAQRPCPSQFRLAALGDIQTNPLQFEAILDDLRRQASSEQGPPLLGLLILGDLAEDSSEIELLRIEQLLEGSAVPVAVTAGNHDIYSGGAPNYNRIFGPGNYRFSLCGTGITMLDTGSGGLAESVEASLPRLFARRPGEQHGIVGMHYPPYPGLTGNPWSRDDQAQALLVESVIADLDLVLAGHVHALKDYPKVAVADDSVHQIIIGTAGASQVGAFPVYGYLELVFDGQVGGRPDVCFVEVPPAGTSVGEGVIPDSLAACRHRGRSSG